MPMSRYGDTIAETLITTVISSAVLLGFGLLGDGIRRAISNKHDKEYQETKSEITKLKALYNALTSSEITCKEDIDAVVDAYDAIMNN